MADSMKENVFLPFLSSVCKNNKLLLDVKHLLDITEENNFFSIQNPGKLQDVISHMHTCLNAAKQRAVGLLLLDKVLEQCVTEVFTHNALTWIRFMVQIFESHDSAPVKKLACQVCCRIIKIASEFTSLSRDVTALIPQILTPLISPTTQWKNEAFQCINACITYYPGPCGTFKIFSLLKVQAVFQTEYNNCLLYYGYFPECHMFNERFQGKIDAVVVEELNKDNVPEECITCYAFLSVCGGGGSMGVKYTEGWTVQCDRVLSSFHDVVNLLYEGLDIPLMTPNENSSERQSIFVGELPDAYAERCQVLLSRFRSSAACLNALLSPCFPAQVRIPVKEILQLLCKALSVNCKKLTSRPSTERLQLSAVIPVIHSIMVSVLQSLISSCKQNLLPYSKLVVNLLVQGLAWSSTTPVYGQEKPYSGLRRSLYDCLSLWLQTTRTFVETMTEESVLVREIILDAKPQVDTLKITSMTGSSSKSDGPPPSKKKKRSGYQEISQGISTQRKISVTAGSTLTTSALKCLYWLVTTVGTKLVHKSLQTVLDFVISTAMSVCQKKKDQPIPYIEPECRLQLLRVLQACTLVPHPSVPSPLQCAIGIFQLAGQDSDLKVSSFCLEAQLVLEVMIHPRAPCLKSPVVCDAVNNIKEVIDAETKDTTSTVTSGMSPGGSQLQQMTVYSSQINGHSSQSNILSATPASTFESYLSTAERTDSEIDVSMTSPTQKIFTSTQSIQHDTVQQLEIHSADTSESAKTTSNFNQAPMDMLDISQISQKATATSSNNASSPVREETDAIRQENGAEESRQDEQLSECAVSDSQAFSQSGNETLSCIDIDFVEDPTNSDSKKTLEKPADTDNCDNKKDNEKCQDLEEMLATFADADPDQEDL